MLTLWLCVLEQSVESGQLAAMMMVLVSGQCSDQCHAIISSCHSVTHTLIIIIIIIHGHSALTN